MTATTIATSAATANPGLALYYRRWLNLWCAVVALFGVILAGAAFPMTDAPSRALLTTMGGIDLPTLDRALRFSVALMGAVTLGWALTIAAAIPAIEKLAAPDRRRAWHAVLLAVLAWFVVDSALSIATGFALNAVSNAALLAAFVIPLVTGRALVE